MLFSVATLMEYSVLLMIGNHSMKKLSPISNYNEMNGFFRKFEEKVFIVDAHFAIIVRVSFLVYAFSHFIYHLCLYYG